MTSFDNQRVAFHIGQDTARYGLPPAAPDHRAYMEGYRLGGAGRPLASDRFVRKWLQVRTNAWRRNRHVAQDFSIGLLRDLDRPTCPVSGVAFTHGAGKDSDWSVDRIDNDGGYTAGNVLLVSTRVNREKGARSLSELLALGDAPPAPSPGGLTAIEWRRLAWFASTQDVDPGHPVRVAYPDGEHFPHLCMPWCGKIQQVQVEWTRRSATMRRELWTWLHAYAPDFEGTWLLAALREAVTDYARGTDAAARSALACFADPLRWARFAAWWRHLARTGALDLLLAQLGGGLPDRLRVDVGDYRARKQAASKGYG